jgi:hypothetical protein
VLCCVCVPAGGAPPAAGTGLAEPPGGGVGQMLKDTLITPTGGTCCAVLCCAVLCCAVLCCAVLCCAVLCCAVLCCAVLCCAVHGAPGRWQCILVLDDHAVSRFEYATAYGMRPIHPLPTLVMLAPCQATRLSDGSPTVATAAHSCLSPPSHTPPPPDADDTEVLNLAAPEVSSRSAHSYSGQGTGCVEARMADAAAAGMGAAHRRMGRSRSADSPGSAAAVTGGKSGAKPMGEVSNKTCC